MDIKSLEPWELLLLAETTGETYDRAERVVNDLVATHKRAEQAETEVERMRDAILAVRAVDSGAWLKDCTTVLCNCADGHEERRSLMRSLNQLYKALAEPED